MIHRVARDKTRRSAIQALQIQNLKLWTLVERCDKDNPQLRKRLEDEYARNVQRIEKIELLDAGAAAYPEPSGCAAQGSPRLAEDADVPEDWRVRVAGVLEEHTQSVDPDGQYGLFRGGDDD